MRSLLLLTIIFGAIPFILARPHIGILFWSWISYMNPHRFTYGLAHDFPVAYLVAVVTFIGLLFSRDRKGIPWNSVTVTWLALILWMCVTTLFALVPDDAHTEWIRAMKIQVMSFVTLMVITTPGRIKALVWIIALSIGFFGVKGGLFAIATRGEQMIFGPPESFIEDNTSVALAIVMVIPFMRFLQLEAKQRWIRLGLLGAMGFSSLAVLSSYSRGAFLAIAAMAAFLIMKTRQKALFIAVVLIAAPIMWNFMPEKYHERLGTIESYSEDASAMGRINAWHFAWNVATARPLTGGGFEVFDPELFKQYAPNPMDFHDAHSIYFQILGEQGFVGLALFLLLGWLTFRHAGRIVAATEGRSDLRWAHDLAGMIQVSLVGYAVGGAFLGLAYWDLPYHLTAMTVLSDVLVRKALADSEFPQAAADASLDEGGAVTDLPQESRAADQ